MNRLTQPTRTLRMAATAATLLVLASVVPAAAAGGPYALQIPEQLPGPMVADLQHPSGGDGDAPGPARMEDRHSAGMMPLMQEMHREALATQEILDVLVARLDTASGDERMDVMAKLVETLVAERGRMIERCGTPMESRAGTADSMHHGMMDSARGSDSPCPTADDGCPNAQREASTR